LIALSAGDPRIDAFHRGIYQDEFADQSEPVERWHAALRGERAYELSIQLALDGERILGGICFERYPRTGCGLLTYVVVAPEARGQGLGKQLQTAALDALRGAPLVLGELNDPRVTTLEPTEAAWTRLRRNQRSGAGVIEMRYVQPALGDGLPRDRQLLLMVFPPFPSPIDGARLRAFIDELYQATEGGPPDPEIVISDLVGVVEL